MDEGNPTPLSEELDGLADLITKASYVFAALILVGRIVIYFYMAMQISQQVKDGLIS